MRILIVGGAGYIGSHIVKSLRDNGKSPIVFDNLSSGLKQNLLPGIPFIFGDILSSEQLKKAMVNVDAIIHLAAFKSSEESMYEPEKYSVNNITGTINLLNAAVEANIKYFVFSSSASVYGDPQYLPLDEQHPTNPSNFYGQTKLTIENLLKWYSRIRGIKYCSLRYFNAAGYDFEGEINGLENKPNNLLPIVLETIFGKRKKLEVFGTDYKTRDGSCIRDYIHVNDLASAHLLSIDFLMEENRDLVANLGTSRGISVIEILKRARDVSDNDFKFKFGPRRSGDPAIVVAKADLAKKLLGWEPNYSDLQTILDTMISAYRKNL